MLPVRRVCRLKSAAATVLLAAQRSVTSTTMTGAANAATKYATTSHLRKDGPTNRGYTVCVEGNIGSGKTTLLEHFLTIPNVQVFPEPVNMWRNVRGHNALGKMYENPERWSMALQTYVQLTMVDLHTRPQKEPVRLMERSILSARYCFLENLHRSGSMPDIEYVILDEWYKWIMKTQDIRVDLIVYLRTTPETCYERIKQRCREEETGIQLELLQRLHDRHEEWLIQKCIPCDCPVLMLDANGDLTHMFEQYREKEDYIMGRKAAAS